MSNHKSATKEKEKGAQLVIRVAKSERVAFIAACEDEDTSAGREIRRFMREYLAAKAPQPQPTGLTADLPSPAEPAVVETVVEHGVTEVPAPEDTQAQPSLEAAEKPKKARKSAKA